MKNKDRTINNFLSIVFLSVGIYMTVSSIWAVFQTGTELLFEFQNQDVPAFRYILQLVSGLVSIMTGFATWLRASWSPGFAMFTSGLLIAYTIGNMGRAIYSNPTEAVLMAVILIILLQSFPYLIRRTDRFL